MTYKLELKFHSRSLTDDEVERILSTIPGDVGYGMVTWESVRAWSQDEPNNGG